MNYKDYWKYYYYTLMITMLLIGFYDVVKNYCISLVAN